MERLRVLGVIAAETSKVESDDEGEPLMNRIAARIIVALVISALSATGIRGPAEADEKIKITVPATSTTFAPLYHAKAAGYFTEEGLDVEVVMIPGPPAFQAVIAGDAQFAMVPGTYQLMAYERGQRLTAVLNAYNRNSVNVVMHKDVARAKGITEHTALAEKLRALKGLRLGGSAPGSFSHQVLAYYVLKAGLDPQKDVEIVGLGSDAARLAALEQRQIDVFVTGTPTPEAAVSRGFGVMLVDNSAGTDPDFAEFMMNVLLATPATLKQQPAMVRKTVRAVLKSCAWLLDHEAEQAIPFMKPVLRGLDDALILTGLQKTRLGISRDGRVTERAVTLTQELLRKVGALKTVTPYEQLVTHEFLPR